MNLSDLQEGGTIAALASILSRRPLPSGWLGIGDDAAITTLAGPQALTTVDMLVEGIHFTLAGTTPEDLGWKTLAVNVSDIYAMGGSPRWAVVAIALRGDLPVTWLEGFYRGLSEAAEAFATPIVGGDTVGTPGPLALSLTVVGDSAKPRLRSTARPGDILAVTGPLGLSAAGLWALQNPTDPLPPLARQRAQAAHRRPQPPGYSAELAKLARLALMDDSDGLGTSARQLAEASGVAAVLEADRLQPDPDVAAIAAVAGVDPLDWILWGGEDYGLVAALPPDATLPAGFIQVGRFEEGSGAHVEREGCQTRLERGGFRHF